ncbi:hypothetical protein E9993_17010 [Labilibacter sediminis]|nr:hypothetical protein E9993_17010 [Labilibacter sediminis]
MKDINELFDEEENFEPKIWVNKSDSIDAKKYKELIYKLESLTIDYKHEDFIWLKSDNRTYEFGYENNQFHFFMYCIDWSELYELTDSRLTIYDVLISSSSEKKRKSKFKEAYDQIKKLFDGNIAFTQDLVKCRDVILKRISEGLAFYQTSKGFKSKGLNEFFKMLFDKMGNVDYEVNDFSTPYLTGESQRSRFIIDVYDKIIPAFEVAKIFNKEFKDNILSVSIDNFFVMHVLLRHTVTFKFKEIYSPVIENTPKIKDGLCKLQKLTAHIDSDGTISIISQDGEFFPPDFSYSQTDYIDYLNTGEQLNLEKIAENLLEKLKILVPIFIENINSAFSPNIIYSGNMLYGFEFPAWKYRNESIIELSSFYPLNSEYQQEKGISQKDFDSITNKSSIPESYKIKIEK